MPNTTLQPGPTGSVVQATPYMRDEVVEAPLSREDAEVVMSRIYERGDRIVGRFLLLHALLACVLSFFYDTWLVSTVVTVCAVSTFVISKKLLPRSVTTRYLAGLALQCFVALHIYQLHGMAEMHFFFFTGFTVMIVYQDWKCFWPGAFAIIGQHLLFAIFHNLGVNVQFFDPGYVGVTKLAFHFSIVVAQVGICGYWAHLLRRQTLAQAEQHQSLENANARLRTEMAERHAAEVARRDAEAQYRRVADNLPGIVFQFSRTNEGRYRFHYISEGSRDIFRGEPDQIVTDPALVFDRVHSADRPSLFAAIEESTYLFAPLRWEGRTVVNKEQMKYIQIGGRPAAQADGSTIWDGVIVDITELRTTAAAASAAREEAERANRAKSEFLSRMSHELRTPLNSILGFGQLLARSGLPEKQLSNVDFILSGGRHLLKLVNEVLDISRIETGNITLSIEAIGVEQLINDVLALMRPLAEQQKIKLNPPDVGTSAHFVLADLQRLNQVLLNILSNAVKYNREGGEVSISCAPFVCEGGAGREDAPWLRIDISDTGFGMRAEDLDRLFTPFDRLGAEARAIEGTGIGLALSKRLLETMGGRISVRTIVDEGSTFSVELPITEAPNRAVRCSTNRSGGKDAAVPQRIWKVLCIEDNLANREVIEGIFEDRADIEILSAMQGRIGLELARDHQPDVILLDAHLPDLPGAEVLVRLQAEPSTRKIPVILVSADATPRQIQRLRSLGARDYVTKPFEIDVLIDVLDRTLKSVETAEKAGMAPA